MQELIARWERQADKCEKRGRESTNSLTAEGYLAEAQALRVCASELRVALREENTHHLEL